MANKKMTIEDLAVMVQKGFDKTATKDELKEGLAQVSQRLDKVETRLDRIENIILRDYQNRLERLEDKVLMLEKGGRK